MMDLDILYVL